ncbi:MAG: DUF1549 and DUF1553 domain-containing protein [Planctomycetaceae bacterium]
MQPRAQSSWLRLFSSGVVCGLALLTMMPNAWCGAEASSSGPAAKSTAEFIDDQIERSWADNEIKPSPEAPDEEWVRRVYLDTVGRIPSLKEVETYLADSSPRKRAVLVDALLDHPDYVRNFTTIWTNLCMGRADVRRVSRPSLEKFFREAFAKNRPWNDVVVDIVTAEGHFEENGAVNYILAQMQLPDDGVQLTAKTTRLFLGMQVQCTQCHNHPFNDWQQSQFWEFNSFFRQVSKRDYRRTDPNSGRQVDDYSEVVWQDYSGPVHFEKRSGLMEAAYPIYLGRKIDAGPDTDRRKELARLLVEPNEGETPLLATAFVNRMWGHFFGYGFTRPVDDIGPHNPASHPALLERLAADFASGGYNVRQLVRWIANSRAYSLTSQLSSDNRVDDPASGEMPLFSHMYIKSMEAEQLYDSLITASNADKAGNGGWDAQEAQRRRWMQQFVVTFDNDENDEATTFNGTIPQALMMMNSDLMERAVSADRGSLLFEVLNSPGPETQKIQKLYLAALSRRPGGTEMSTARQFLSAYPASSGVMAWQDMFWALLNSNEFILNH